MRCLYALGRLGGIGDPRQGDVSVDVIIERGLKTQHVLGLAVQPVGRGVDLFAVCVVVHVYSIQRGREKWQRRPVYQVEVLLLTARGAIQCPFTAPAALPAYGPGCAFFELHFYPSDRESGSGKTLTV